MDSKSAKSVFQWFSRLSSSKKALFVTIILAVAGGIIVSGVALSGGFSNKATHTDDSKTAENAKKFTSGRIQEIKADQLEPTILNLPSNVLLEAACKDSKAMECVVKYQTKITLPASVDDSLKQKFCLKLEEYAVVASDKAAAEALLKKHKDPVIIPQPVEVPSIPYVSPLPEVGHDLPSSPSPEAIPSNPLPAVIPSTPLPDITHLQKELDSLLKKSALTNTEYSKILDNLPLITSSIINPLTKSIYSEYLLQRVYKSIYR